MTEKNTKNKNFAVIETGGKQYKVREGERVRIEKLDVKEEDKVKLDRVLLKSTDEKVEVGTPLVEGSEVEAKVVKNGRFDKKIVFKYHAKTRYKKKKGHKQPFTEIEVLKIK
ncbi:MAG: 50S ribosomal protein L21 [Candidatus Paceibacterota bacterium]